MTTYYKGFQINYDDIRNCFLSCGLGKQFISGTMADALTEIDDYTTKSDSAPVLNYRRDIKAENTKISCECYMYLDCEYFYIEPSNVDPRKREVIVTIGSQWMFFRKPPKKILTWFENYIYRKYNYTVVDFI